MQSPRVVSDPEILGGTPVFVGTRVPVRILFEHLEVRLAWSDNECPLQMIRSRKSSFGNSQSQSPARCTRTSIALPLYYAMSACFAMTTKQGKATTGTCAVRSLRSSLSHPKN